jgi:mono/diheme cytochrome c family protein
MIIMKLKQTVLLAFLAFTLSGCAFSLAEDILPPPGSDVSNTQAPHPSPATASFFPVVPPDPTQGAAIYIEKCAPCHGETGSGDGPSAAELSVPVAPLSDPELARQRSPADWFTIVTRGNIERFMPPFASLTDRQRWDVVAYAFSLSETEALVSSGAELYQANCASCHGETGMGDGPLADGLSVQPGDFTNLEEMADRTAADLVAAIRLGVGEAMPAYESQISEAEMWALAAAIRSLGYATGKTGATAPDSIDAQPEASADEPNDPAAIEDPEQAEAAALGTVQIRLKDSQGNPVLDDYPVTLYIFDKMQFVESTTLTESVDGIYRFENVPLAPERAFLSSVDYQGVTYGSDVAVPGEPDRPLDLEITVFETTTDASTLVVDRLHIFFDFSVPENVQIVELYILRNMTNRTIVAEEEGGPVVHFNLPEEATNLQFEDGALGERYLLTEGGFADTRAVRAGSSDYQVVFAYNLPYDRKLSFSALQKMPINSAVILAPEGIKLRGDNLQDEGLRDIQGISYQMYAMSSLPAGSLIKLEISGKPKSAGASLPDSQTGLLIGLGALGLALIVAGVWLFRRERTPDEMDEALDEASDEDDLDDNAADPEQLMDAIIALDDLYKAGELPEEAYQQRRSELKTRLERILG